MMNSPNGPVLLGVDVHGIQRYLFATSKLKEVIGASRIVDDFTGGQPDDVPVKCLGRLGLSPSTSGVPTGERWYIPVRLGGGAVRLLLPDADLAKRFVRAMSEWALVHASGLEFDADWVAYDLSTGNYAEANRELIQRIHAKRQETSGGNGFNGFPFCAPCKLTGDPAEGYDGQNERLSAASLDKRAYQSRQDERWATLSNQPIFAAFKVDDPRRPFIFDLESMLGDSAADSYIAVIALDLNSLGEAGRRILGTAKGGEALHRMHALVEGVAGAVAGAFRTALNDLANNPDSSHEFEAVKGVIDRCGKLPIRPLVFGGDDLTFVMHATLAPRFAISLARALDGAGYSSGVGIAFVKTKSPLSRAIDLAEALLVRAKGAGREKTRIDFMLCSREIPRDASDRDASGGRPARGPYNLAEFELVLANARLLKHELPNTHIRGAVDGFKQGLAQGRACLDDLIENIERGLGGGVRATEMAYQLLQDMRGDDAVAATYLDCVDLFRFIAPRPDRSTGAQLDGRKTEVTA